MTPLTDQELKLGLAEFLKEELKKLTGLWPIEKSIEFEHTTKLCWRKTGLVVQDTELLEICHRIEGKFTQVNLRRYEHNIWRIWCRAGYIPNFYLFCVLLTWQQRTRAIIEVMGQPNDK